MRKIITGVVEQHLAQATAQHHAEHAIEQQIVQALSSPQSGRVRAAACPATRVQEGEQVHEAVPVHGERAKMDGDGVELGVNEHGGREG